MNPPAHAHLGTVHINGLDLHGPLGPGLPKLAPGLEVLYAYDNALTGVRTLAGCRNLAMAYLQVRGWRLSVLGGGGGAVCVRVCGVCMSVVLV